MSERSNPTEHSGQEPANGDGFPLLGDFEIIERIGQGAVGAVFKARQRSMDRLVAVKVLKPRLARDPTYVARFWNEARAAARLNHPNIVLAIDAGEDHGYCYFVMEYVEGHPVSLLRKAAVFEERRALEIVVQVAKALDYAWSQERIVHRDVKPGNIIITPDGAAKLADLGLAYDAALAEEPDDGSGGAVLGTPLYIAPEQIRREPDLDVRCDLYALGATLFHMVTGHPPFRGPDSKAILAMHLHEPVPDPRELRPELSDGIAHVILKLMAKDRDERYPDAGALIADVEALLETGQLPGRRTRPASPVHDALRRRPRATLSHLFVLCLVFGAVFGAGLAFWRLRAHQIRRRSGPPRPAVGEPLREPAAATGTSVEAPSLAQKDYDAAVAFCEANPEQYVKAIAMLGAVEAGHASTTYAKLAAARRQQLEAELGGKAREALERLKREADRRVAAGRYTDALAAFGRFPDGLATPAWQARLGEARKAAEAAARARFEAALAPGDRAAGAGKLDDALAAYRAIEGSLPAAWREEVAQRIAAARRRQKQLAERAGAAAQAAHLRLMARIGALYRKRQYDAAAVLIKACLDDAAAARRDELQRELSEIGRLGGFWRSVEQGARRFIGKPYSVRGIPGKLSAVKDGQITITTAGRPFTEKLVKLRADEVVRFAEAALSGKEGKMAAARFLIAEGDAAEAGKRLDLLEAAGADVAAQRERLALLRSTAAAQPPGEGEREPAAPPPAGALPARLRLACDGPYKLFLNGKAIAGGTTARGQLDEHTLEVRDGDVLAVEAQSDGPHRGFYALLSVDGGRYLLPSDSAWRWAADPPNGWRKATKPPGTWHAAELAYSPHAKPGYGRTGKGLPGYWVWGRGGRCCFHKTVRLGRTAEQDAERERARQRQLTAEHGKPVEGTVSLASGGAYHLYLNGRRVGCAATAVPEASYRVALRDGDVVGVHAVAADDGRWLSARIEAEHAAVPLRTDRSWACTPAPAPEGWNTRGGPAGVWRASEFVDGGPRRVWGGGREVLFRKAIDLERLRAKRGEAIALRQGHVEQQGWRRAKVTYDFAEPGQLADWHSEGALAWSKGRIGGTRQPIYTEPYSVRHVEAEIQLEPVADVVIGLWGREPGRRNGYTLSVSGDRRPTVVFRRKSDTLRMDKGPSSSAATRRIVLRRFQRLFTVAIDGSVVFSVRDSDPIPPETLWRIGFIPGARGKAAVKAVRIVGRLDWDRPPDGREERRERPVGRDGERPRR